MKPQSEPDSRSQSLSVDDQIREDLETCIAAVALIPAEQEKIRKAIDGETNPVKRDYLWWQHDFIDRYIRRAARVAERRRGYIYSLTDLEGELDLCHADKHHWFQYYAWSLDPRVTALPVAPFYPFNVQTEAINWLDDRIRGKQSDGLIDKSRDMGVSWLAVLLSTYYWRFVKHFQALFGSYKEELIDSKEEPDTLLEKVRFQLRRTPSWMLPRGFNFKEHAGYMKIINPQGESNISGAAPTVDFGRAGRYTVIWFDEQAAWRFGGYPQWTASSQSSRSKISVSTPKGKFTKQAELRFSGTMPVFSMHWKRHPWKDNRWYQGQALTMSSEEIAQELDIDYEASQPGRIFTMWTEIFGVITEEEFARVYGTTHIPLHWNLGRCQDVGTTDEHLNVTAWYAKPGKQDPFPDTIFSYREYVAPSDWTCETIAEGIRDEAGNVIEDGIMQFETPLKEARRMSFSLISQEGESEMRTYAKTCKRYPLRFARIKKPEANAGIAQMRALMTPLPEPNPFVIDPRTLDLESEMYVDMHDCEVCKSTHAGAHMIGRTRFILIVKKEEGELQWDGEKLYRLPALTNLGGHKEARYEYPLYHYPQTEKDKPVAARKPFKRADDRIDDDRYVCRLWGPPAAKPSPDETLEAALPENLRLESLPKATAEHPLTQEERDQMAERLLARTVIIAEKGLAKRPTGKAVNYRKKRRER